jgi:ubiquitin-protein ligase
MNASFRRIIAELEVDENYPTEGVHFVPSKDDLLILRAWIVGTEGSVYEGGMFEVKIDATRNYHL